MDNNLAFMEGLLFGNVAIGKSLLQCQRTRHGNLVQQDWVDTRPTATLEEGLFAY